MQVAKQKKQIEVRVLVQIGLMTAVTCVVAPFSIPLPFSPVPISLTMLALYLSVYAVGTWKAAVSYLIYLLLGFVGLPVFSGFTAGPGKLFGPTGGYLIAFWFLVLITGFFVDKFDKRILDIVGMVLGITCAYVLGSLWLSIQTGMSLSAAFMAGTIPFIPADIAKIILAVIIGPQIRKTLKKANLF